MTDGQPRSNDAAPRPDGEPDDPDLRFDALVIGAGAGGMAAAARLSNFGYRTLLVESRDRVGGRASTKEVGEFTVHTGALIITTGGENERLFDELGADMGVSVPDTPMTLRLGRLDVPLTKGPVGALANGSLRLVNSLSSRFDGLRPPTGISIGEWITARGRKPRVMRLIRNLTSAMFAAEPTDVDAAMFFEYFTKKDALNIGVHPDGAIGPWQVLANVFERDGGTLWLSSTVDRLTFDGAGLVNGAVIDRSGEAVTVSTSLAISDVGPLATVGLCGAANLPEGYGESVRATSRPSTLIVVHFASRIPLRKLTGLTLFASTTRLAYAMEVTAMSPTLAPPGWYLYAAASSPHPASGDFDSDAEVAILKRELADNYPEFGRARIVSVDICGGDVWPAQRAIIGHDWPQTTPVANLWNVGDGAREHGQADQSGCVGSARIVTDQIRRDHPPRSSADLRIRHL
ncbi:NAD(P)-binding protein [Williamsia soli]|uniref:NAD(P)-binding protein n=1 Tax=Williamsia soli TaxID=364929 RepID=UPI001A9D98A9|nr:NAD(P)-binding protein [Williamsia soli]